MTWYEQVNCVGQDQADNITPPRDGERWNLPDAALVAAALTRCAACLAAVPCAVDALEDHRDGANGGIYSYHSGKGSRRWVLRDGTLQRLPKEHTPIR